MTGFIGILNEDIVTRCSLAEAFKILRSIVGKHLRALLRDRGNLSFAVQAQRKQVVNLH